MLKVVVFLVLLFLALLAVRWLRLFVASFFSLGRRPARGRIEGEMVRDPVCGVWVDRRLAIPVGSRPRPELVCSEKCRRLWESSGKRAAG